jgi:SecD/SecF fusion protein
MSIDACVLSFERIKEELWQGKSISAAFDQGYKRSFSTILDSNITTLIVAIVLFILGESSVKGFATMLIISIGVTLFAMVFVIKYILRALIDTGFFDKKPRAFINVKKDDIPDIVKNEKSKKDQPFRKLDFLKHRKIFYFTALGINILGIVFALFTPLNLSVDYKGGSGITINSENNLNINDLKKDIKTLGYKYNTIDSVNDKTVYIKIDNALSKEEIKKAKAVLTS